MSHNDEWIGQGWIGMGMVAVGNQDAMSFDGHTDDFLKKIGKVFFISTAGLQPAVCRGRSFKMFQEIGAPSPKNRHSQSTSQVTFNHLNRTALQPWKLRCFGFFHPPFLGQKVQDHPLN